MSDILENPMVVALVRNALRDKAGSLSLCVDELRGNLRWTLEGTVDEANGKWTLQLKERA